MTTAFDPYDLAGLPLANRIVMAPMTRCRALRSGEATPLMAEYYAQRAGAGLIVTEGVSPSAVGLGYTHQPGLFSAEQVVSWRPVTDAVHAAGGTIFTQLMHAGRIGHSATSGQTPLAPSAVAPAGKLYTYDGMKEFETPVALREEQIEQTIADFATAAENAIAAGFDGVEIHGGTGYLVHQFLAANTNTRDDEWGGDAGSRGRFAVEVTRAAAAAIGAHRVGIRLSPGGRTNDILDHSDLDATYLPLLAELAPLGLAYLHLIEHSGRELSLRLRAAWPGTLILNPDTAPERTGLAELPLIQPAAADLLSFGGLFLANPDLPARLAAGGPFTPPDRATFYSSGPEGYTDYPFLSD